jgi:hypothetical protein
MDTFKIGCDEEDVNDVLGTYYMKRATYHFCISPTSGSSQLLDYIGIIQTREGLAEELKKYQSKEYTVLAVNDVIAISNLGTRSIDLYCNAIDKNTARKTLLVFFDYLGERVDQEEMEDEEED